MHSVTGVWNYECPSFVLWPFGGLQVDVFICDSSTTVPSFLGTRRGPAGGPVWRLMRPASVQKHVKQTERRRVFPFFSVVSKYETIPHLLSRVVAPAPAVFPLAIYSHNAKGVREPARTGCFTPVEFYSSIRRFVYPE